MFKPRLPWTKNYAKTDLRDDFFAGMTTAVMLIPQAMAYALLAGLSVEVGLYASTIPIFMYAFLGTARSLAVGPVALDSLLTFSAVEAIALTQDGVGEDERLMMATLLAFMVGIVLILMGLLRLGRFVSLLTPTIISSFTSAAAILIGINQMKLILGVEVVRSPKVYVIVADIFSKLGNTHVSTFAIGLVAIATLVALKRFAPKVPRAFVVVGFGVLTVVLGDLGATGVQLVGEVPEGLPTFQTPWMDWGIVVALIPHALIIALVAFMESYSISSKLKKEHEELQPSSELVALGSANIATGLFQGYSVTGGLSRSAVNDAAGAKSQVSALITGTMVVLTLSFFSGILANIPKAVLGAIIMTAVAGLISVEDAKDVFKQRKSEIPVYLVTFLVTLLVGVKEGLIAGVLVNLVLKRQSNNGAEIEQSVDTVEPTILEKA